ncbi:MAG TPA: type II toxin-antitoxin system VapC family toxin [Solirubrobacterales bacterium]|jgi:predicted nucleic acid-binding protein|nr:type II toxin-antitoxin system VapC family toxin [Solirubrobacterales bacterium]
MIADGTLLLDAGVWIASRDPEDRYQHPALELTFDTKQVAGALDLTLFEVANGVVRRWNDSRAAAKLCRSVELRCKENFVRVDAGLMEATSELAVEHGLTSYDAAYVAVARRYDWQLVSTDIEDLVSKGLAITPDAAV